jgi:1-acyl-sn-glycerol-3-phosphate acyltransferase
MRNLLAWLRFVAVILSMAFLVLAVLIFYNLSLEFIRHPIRKIWTRCLLASAGAQIRLHGLNLSKIDLKNTMMVSNHISWLDTVVMLRLCYLRYIGKVEMLRWPILSMIIKAGGTIFIDRRKKREILTVNQQVANILTEGATVGLYPEGTTSDGVKILPFKAPILESALMAKSNIIPVVLSYRKEDDKLATEVTFAKVNWLTTVMNTLRLKNLVINVTLLPIVKSTDFASRDELAEYLYQQINQSYQNQQHCMQLN